MANPIAALRKGLLAKLDTLVDCEVYDGVADNTAYPYVVMDMETTTDVPFTNYRMDSRFFYLSVWSRVHGSYEVNTIISQIDGIHETPITLDTGEVVSVRVVRTHVNREPDNLTFMGQVTLRIFTTH